MIKKIFAPVQAWILLQGKCVGCGKSLTLAIKNDRRDNRQQVICSCGRIFIFDKRNGRYRRALQKEII
ncbi:hypothetical protein A3A54_01620 [Candidatus Curtissbacteria bacterium RIFCSPLOWO2_01_FULL_39_62]|uniref:Uncharacterized protein n=2 Tax=Candidatus Curtissiibacteriota TaxID=1752717 RepID=A0A1F5G7P6_9BACT|nr:MAG: hypothetical protein A2775_00975 [Candidatus Curtissbacteria bacterium RIFCSPHIGHO2_01_FULL_39_57]OGD87844.1 MAG: hypothetical protein A3D04_02650 [Candidatus Curtissbacteria bacterium RIFCSPHIGHO2_02_FULL_40_16b]OGD90408.1 MAG: hypothetical protein A3E11_00130 [Candidatus Curtissbacteria bacterium RIFCSPHIGHO2_12_FULL_38_37]OGD99786.1 MAG: hypothetical protein A3J17_04355 [Candidatus Curtissbacteria bacterium RIFCSPLOWO2_02_FULL_40_11]OGE00841.1 MAG: hypothetical protein A3A54_01620 [C